MVKVAVLGAAGGIGQPLSLLLCTSSGISSPALYDIVNTPGVGADLGHINSGMTVSGYLPEGGAGLEKALTGANVVVIPAGVPRKPGMTRDDLFKINAGIVRDLATGIAKYCPTAFVCVISNPVNSTVPIVAEVLKNHGVFDPRRLFGVTTLDSVRASTFLSQVTSLSHETRVPIYGGHSGHTIVPIFSHVEHGLSQAAIEQLVHRVQFGGDEVVQAKDGAGSATLSMAFAAKRFTDAVIAGMNGTATEEVSYITLDDRVEGAAGVKAQVGCDYFATQVVLGPNGIEKALPLGAVNDYEKGLLEKAAAELKGSISKGIEFVAGSKM